MKMNLNMDYHVNYEKKSSLHYKNLFNDINKAIEESMKKSLNTELQTFSGIGNLIFSNGSIKAAYEIFFISKKRPLEKITKMNLTDNIERSIINNSTNWQRLQMISYSIEKIQYDFLLSKETTTELIQSLHPPTNNSIYLIDFIYFN